MLKRLFIFLPRHRRQRNIPQALFRKGSPKDGLAFLGRLFADAVGPPISKSNGAPNQRPFSTARSWKAPHTFHRMKPRLFRWRPRVSLVNRQASFNRMRAQTPLALKQGPFSGADLGHPQARMEPPTGRFAKYFIDLFSRLCGKNASKLPQLARQF